MENNIGTGHENNKDVYMEIDGKYQVRVNGDTVDNAIMNVKYNGNELDLEAKRNDEAVYMKLNNDDILKLLEVPAYHKTISQRLRDDLNDNNIDVRPIIIEELENILSNKRNHSNSKKKQTRTKQTRTKHNSKEHNTKSNGNRSITKNKSNANHNHNHNHNNNMIVPDYLKTIY